MSASYLFSYFSMSSTHTDTLPEDTPADETSPEKQIPEIAKKVSRFGNQGNMSKFGKWATAFNPPNKQRPGRAAGRGR